MKPREESLELKIMRSLLIRMGLPGPDELYYLNLKQGFEGESEFDDRIVPLLDGRLVINDLLLEHHNTLFQIDSLMISTKSIYLFEVKNYCGDFYVDGERWYSIAGNEIKNPLLQVQRNESLLRRLLQDLGCNIPVEAYLIFVNPEFHLYQAPLNQNIIFPTQLNRFLENTKKKTSRLQGNHKKIAEQLLSLHLTETPNFRLPDYRYEQLKKGIYCPSCFGFYQQNTRLYFFCAKCGEKEDYETAVLRSVQEFKLLFPDDKITTNQIHEWCKITKEKKSTRKILYKNYKQVGHGKSSYYVK
ncbi:nuclease-related domain-containing protein [Pseudalkalibacillus salsuginis]|uniref:nuclease-related domain-containing protein n=1 Tax=Pseudalkalibacillus salsuginis TaxID=2910972 RepID=UPI001F169695|nr:nuclease-related domain-containing protein [Pseudalkalibacillus salsuginis]MCF6409787.1 NERD domain-containing protein [Pseudalkalibacillus salsuginis]